MKRKQSDVPKGWTYTLADETKKGRTVVALYRGEKPPKLTAKLARYLKQRGITVIIALPENGRS